MIFRKNENSVSGLRDYAKRKIIIETIKLINDLGNSKFVIWELDWSFTIET